MSEKLTSQEKRDIRAAKFQARLSGVANKFPPRLNFAGWSDSPSYLPVRWRYGMQAGDYPSAEWLTFESGTVPDPDVSSLPRSFKKAAILLIDRQMMERLTHDTHGTAAVAYLLGSSVMYGTQAREPMLGLEHLKDEECRVAMRIGNEPLHANAGVSYTTGDGYHVYMPFPHGVRPGPVVPFAELPPTIPLI